MAVPPIMVDNLDEIKKELGSFALPNCLTLPPVLSNAPAYDYELNFQHVMCPNYEILSNRVVESTVYTEQYS